MKILLPINCASPWPLRLTWHRKSKTRTYLSLSGAFHLFVDNCFCPFPHVFVSVWLLLYLMHIYKQGPNCFNGYMVECDLLLKSLSLVVYSSMQHVILFHSHCFWFTLFLDVICLTFLLAFQNLVVGLFRFDSGPVLWMVILLFIVLLQLWVCLVVFALGNDEVYMVIFCVNSGVHTMYFCSGLLVNGNP